MRCLLVQLRILDFIYCIHGPGNQLERLRNLISRHSYAKIRKHYLVIGTTLSQSNMNSLRRRRKVQFHRLWEVLLCGIVSFRYARKHITILHTKYDCMIRIPTSFFAITWNFCLRDASWYFARFHAQGVRLNLQFYIALLLLLNISLPLNNAFLQYLPNQN